jgi:hypothetical protein
MKQKKIIITTIALLGVTGISSLALAESMENTTYDKPYVKEGTSTTTTMSESDYWAMKKVENQRKSTEMRKAKYAAMKEKGFDMSNFNMELLDGAKTDEAAFWKAMNEVMKSKDASNRQNIVNELKKSGVDTSALNADVLNPAVTDEATFWKQVKAVKDQKDIASRMKKVEELKQKGYDTSLFNDEVLRDSEKFWNKVKWVESQKSTRSENPNHMNKGDASKSYEYKNEMKNSDSKSQDGKNQVRVPNVRQDKPALSEKMRANLVKRLQAIPEDKQDAYYEKAKANLTKQLEKATASNNKRLVKKLNETLEILEYVLGNDEAEDEAIIDEALPKM